MLKTISQKLTGIAAFAIFQIALIGGISVYQMDKIGTEIHGIAAYDMPLIKIVTQFSEDQLHAEIYYEKAILHGVLWLGGNDSEKPLFSKYVESFNKKSSKSSDEIGEAISLVGSILGEELSEKEENKFKSLKRSLLSIQDNAKNLKAMMDLSFSQIENRNKEAFSTSLKTIEKKIDSSSDEVSSALHDIQEFTLLAAKQAEHDEVHALKLMLAFGFVSLIIFTTFCVLISRTITRSINSINHKLDDLTNGDGDLTVELAVDSEDELATTALKINEFIKKLRLIIQGVNVSADSLGSSSSNAIEVLDRTVLDISQQKNETEMVAAAVLWATS